MRFNKGELSSLASQPSHKFEKEGVLFVREKQDGFFRRSEISVERWCRLRGNLLFYFKSRDHWSEPAGVIIIEDCTVEIDNTSPDSTFGLLLVFAGGQQIQQLATFTEEERDSWLAALKCAPHHYMREHLNSLREMVEHQQKKSREMDAFNRVSNSKKSPCAPVIDPGEPPLMEMCLSCDNLLCDALGKQPSARLIIFVRYLGDSSWTQYDQTEIVEKNSNPIFLRTICFRPCDGLTDKSALRITAYDMRERLTSTRTLLGTANVTSLESVKNVGRIRLKLESPNPEGRTAGFVTLNAWSLISETHSASTDSTPNHSYSYNKETPLSVNGDKKPQTSHHRRSLSLPSAMPHTTKLPQQRALTLLHSNPIIKTYRFHSGLGGDISVQEVMAESKLCFTFPQQLLSLWICEEKELVHEIAGLGELKSPWNTCQMTWLENHLHIINTYSQALENIDNYKGPNYRKSSWKSDPSYEFVPTNYHLQRMWVENESLRKANFYDTSTVGAFTSYGNKSSGLIKMLKELKAPQKDSKAWCSQSDRLQMAEDTLAAVRRVRRQVVDCMRTLMKSGKERKTEGMFDVVEEMLRKTKCLCSLLDQALVEETFAFLEENRVTHRPTEKDEFSESVAEFMQRNKLKIDLPLFCRPANSSGVTHNGFSGFSSHNHNGAPSQNNMVRFETFQTPTTEFVSKELRTPEVDIFSPSDASAEFWRSYSAYTSGYQSVDRLSDIDEFEESFKYLSVIDKTRHYYTLCRTGSPMDTTTPETGPSSTNSPLKVPQQISNESVVSDFDEKVEADDEGIVGDDEQEDEKEHEEEEEEASEAKEVDEIDDPKQESSSSNKDLVTDSPSGLHYRAGDEPEPIELTHLNIEAAMMCLASKIRVLCGKANSPTLSSRTFRFKELDAARKIPKSESGGFKIPDVPKPSMMNEAGLESIDWASELRPSMRKLRQGMDSLCKTARLVCSVLRLQQLKEAVDLSRAIKHRRDVCFSQALTSLLSALMAQFWCRPPDLTFLTICIELGPLVTFESLLSLHGEDVAIFNDMIVAVEDLRNVEFTFILVDKRTKKSHIDSPSREPKQNFVPILEYQTFPLPRVTGSRSALKVMLPVPDFVYAALPMETIKNATFSVTPVLFNIGINEKASIAGQFGLNGPQEKNNLDNFKILSDYYRRYKNLTLPPRPVSGLRKERRYSSLSNESEIEDLLAILKNEVYNKKNKNVEILHLASNISRRLSGLRFTSCKSAKDRTGMSVTLEQVQILSREYDLAQPEFQRAVDVMRSEGTRRDNTLKNSGNRSYAFNSLQLKTFPYQYKPPVGTYGCKET